jgi:hypothetical protein
MRSHCMVTVEAVALAGDGDVASLAMVATSDGYQ